VRSMVDVFLVLLQPGAGDELQGIKKGAVELADALVVNKADGEQAVAAERTRVQHEQALGLLRPLSPHWKPVVLSVSSLASRGIDDVWATILEHSAKLEAAGERQRRRAEQSRAWMWSLVEEGLRQAFRSDPAVADRIDALERDVEGLKTTPAAAARVLLQAFKHD
jgi:LAO/AO transport system kinase